MPGLTSSPEARDDYGMLLPRSDSVQKRRRVRNRWLVVLAAGLSLTLPGEGIGAQTGSSDESDVPPAAREADGTAPPAVGAVVTGTILYGKSADALTIIRDRHGQQQVYARGDEIPDAGEVVEIHRNYIVVRRGRSLERLGFSSDVVTPMFVPASPGAAQATAPEDHGKVLRRRMFSHPELLLQLVGATAVVEDGQFRGYRVTQPNDPAFLESLGLKPGDLLTAVNGVPLDTVDYGSKVLDTMAGTGQLTFTVRRGDQVLGVSN